MGITERMRVQFKQLNQRLSELGQNLYQLNRHELRNNKKKLKRSISSLWRAKYLSLDDDRTQKETRVEVVEHI